MLVKLLFGADAIMLLFFGLAFQLLPKQIPLYYSASWGEDQIADLWHIVIIPIILHLIFIINKFISTKIPKEQTVLIKVVEYATIFFIVIFTSVFLKIIFLVT
jgi:hypothetical protein